MSDQIKHECGIAIVRLLKPLGYYQEKYGSVLWGFNKLFLLMEKQHNRGQDGAGIGAVKLGMPPGEAFMFRERDNSRNPISKVIRKQLKIYNDLLDRDVIVPEFPWTVKEHWPFGAEVLMGHLRYGTSGGYAKTVCQPYFRKSPWPTRNLMLAGNFNMTNVEDLNQKLIGRGAHPIFDTDTQTVLEEIGYHLDEEHTRLYHELRDRKVPNDEIAGTISQKLEPADILAQASKDWDGGYAFGGLIGNGDAFLLRDPNGIRPAYYFQDDEVVAMASERVALMTIFEKDTDEVREVRPGHAVVVKHSGETYEKQVLVPQERRSCSFERIYFSRGNDPEIYAERKALGAALADQVTEGIGGDVSNSVFSFVPNTAEIAYYGLVDEMRHRCRSHYADEILEAQESGKLDRDTIDRILSKKWVRMEKVAHKDIKLRTFISQEKNRVQMASHVYDITYGVVKPDDHLVVVDDSIVRGTTLKRSIIRILSKTNPKKIIVASTAPQIRYPDCYGIDMSELGKFIAFQAAVELNKETGNEDVLQEIYADCVRELEKPPEQMKNCVKRLYEPFTDEQISAKIAQLVTPKKNGWKGKVQIIYQSIENLHAACPLNTGDWYFTGDYPTPGGMRVVNRAYIYYYEKKEGRSY
ncbi:MAG: amidophosphoribosyltransferase [Puniceicoccales bacterium]